jgi:transcriptional regulator with XRE-family HTH domain
MEDKHLIGDRLAELRKDKNLFQQELADELGIAASTVSSYEIENSSPDDKMKVRLAQYFNISLDYLLGAIDEEIPLIRCDRVDLPKGFPKEKIPEVKRYIDLLMTEHRAKK